MAVSTRYWYVAETYWRRPRFWFFGACYVATFAWWLRLADPKTQVLISFNLAWIAGCFIALHIRRQFGSAAARLVPGFALPHLVIGAAVIGLIWLAIPGVEVALGRWPRASIALHAVAATLTAAVVCWPRVLVLLAASPVILAAMLHYAHSARLDAWAVYSMAIGRSGKLA